MNEWKWVTKCIVSVYMARLESARLVGFVNKPLVALIHRVLAERRQLRGVPTITVRLVVEWQICRPLLTIATDSAPLQLALCGRNNGGVTVLSPWLIQKHSSGAVPDDRREIRGTVRVDLGVEKHSNKQNKKRESAGAAGLQYYLSSETLSGNSN